MRRRPRSRGARAAAAVSAVALLVGGCGSDDAVDVGSGAAGSGEAELEGTITVVAAASLRAGFERIGDDFTAAHPGVEVEFSFGSSATAARQIREGAPADVYASADEASMAQLVDEALVADPVAFARNQLVIVTRPGNPAAITSLADLAGAGVISLCGADVPCGRYAAEALTRAGVTIDESRVTRGQNVTATLTAVTEGDAAAAIVYVTDAVAAGDAVDAVTIPAEHNVVATYPIGSIEGSGEPEVAESFVAQVRSEAGRSVLEELGFLPPG